MNGTELAGRTARITGANNPLGIAAATAQALAREGGRGFLTYLRVSPEKWGVTPEEAREATEPGLPLYHAQRMKAADEVVEAIRREGGTVAAREADLTQTDSIPALYDRAEAKFGAVDILVNSAAHYSNADAIGELTPAVIEETYAVNTRAALLLMDEFVRRHKERQATWGRIVNLSTGPAQCFTTQISYGSSKAAIEAATRAVARAAGPLGITVNAVAPGPTQTGYISARFEEELLPTIPLRRLGTPEDIANAVAFLASDRASWITGQVLRVTGGLDM